MKHSLLIFAIAVSVLTAFSAGPYVPVTVLNGSDALVITTNVSGVFTNRAGTNNVMLTFTSASTNGVQGTNLLRPVLVANDTCGFFTSFRLDGTGTAGPTFTLSKSYDGTNWEAAMTFTTVANGTTKTAAWTNLTVGDFGYVRVTEITNNSIRSITNLCVRWYIKE